MNSIEKKFLNVKFINENIKNLKNIIGRADIFLKKTINNSYPGYILNNLVKFKD
jgi:hypothetical protein